MLTFLLRLFCLKFGCFCIVVLFALSLVLNLLCKLAFIIFIVAALSSVALSKPVALMIKPVVLAARLLRLRFSFYLRALDAWIVIRRYAAAN